MNSSPGRTIYYISNSTLLSGSANINHVMQMCEAFTQNGETTILCCHHELGAGRSLDQLFSYYGVTTRFHIYSTPRPKGALAKLLYSIKCLNLARMSRTSPLIYTRDFISAVLSTLCGFQTIFESHAPCFHDSRIKRLLFFLMLRLSSFKRLVVISESLALWYRNKGVNPKLIKVAHDAARPTVLSQTISNQNATDRLIVGYSGSLNPGKGTELVLRIARLLIRINDISFKIVGGTTDQIEQLKIGAPRNVEFVPRIPLREIPMAINEFSVALLPNQPDAVGYGSAPGNAIPKINIGSFTSPLKLFEYMSGGKPIIASDLPVLRETLKETPAALVPHDDPAPWAEAILRYYHNRPLIQHDGAEMLRIFKGHHTWTARCKNVLE